jgi:tetratricopeptide (TPR) repeat protein
MMEISPDPKKIDFFISYNKRDADWAIWIAWQLETEGYDTRIEAWDFRPGNNFPLEMDKASREANHTILVLSPNCLQSSFCPPEWSVAFKKDPTGDKRILIPVRVQPCSVDGLLSTIIHIDLVGIDDETEAKKILIQGIQEGRTKPLIPPKFPVQESLEPKPNFPGKLPNIWNVPFNRNPNFIGRREILDHLHNELQSGKHAALTQSISGLGGVGKTQLVVEYAYQFASEYDLIWWIRSEDNVTLLGDFSFLGDVIKLEQDESANIRSKVSHVRKWLETNGNWLLIFDNVQRPEDLYSPVVSETNFIPQSSLGHVLITSRNPNWSSIATPFNIQVFSLEEAIEFLQKRTGRIDATGAIDLANELGYLPLALEQAAAFIIETPGMTFQKYLELFRERHQELWKNERPPINYPDTVATTWSISIESIKIEKPDSLDLLNMCAFFASEEIPISFFKNPFTNIDDLGFSLAVKCLKKYSLIDVTSESLSIHRLVQLVTRDNLKKAQQEKYMSTALFLLASIFNFNPDDPKTWRESARIIPHAISVVSYVENEIIDPKAMVQLIENVGGYLYFFGEYNQAKKFDERALKIAERVYGPYDKEVATAANNLGLVLKTLGNFSDAKVYLEKALKINEKLFEPDHERVAAAANNLGSLLQDLGDFSGAKTQYERSIAIYQKDGESRNPEISKSVNNLGRVLHQLGDFSGARKQFEYALELDEKKYGPIHPEVARDLNNLALLLQDLGEPLEAKTKFERSLKIYENLFDPNHPEIATSINNLGRVLQDLGDLPGAKKQLERALEISERRFGTMHPEIALVANNLGVVLLEMGDLLGARKHVERALSIDEKFYGTDHVEVATEVNNLGTILSKLGDFPNAKIQFERALKIGEKVYSHDHPHMARTINNLGGVFFELGNFTDAKIQFERGLKICENLYEPDNLEIGKAVSKLGEVFMFLGEFSEADIQLERAYRIFLKRLGPEHEYTENTRMNLKFLRSLPR